MTNSKFLPSAKLPKWFGERPGKKSGEPETPEGEEDAKVVDEEEVEEEEVEAPVSRPDIFQPVSVFNSIFFLSQTGRRARGGRRRRGRSKFEYQLELKLFH